MNRPIGTLTFLVVALASGPVTAQCRSADLAAVGSMASPDLVAFANSVGVEPFAEGVTASDVTQVDLSHTSELTPRAIASVCVDIAVRYALPLAYEAASLPDAARALRQIPQLSDRTTPEHVVGFSGHLAAASRHLDALGDAPSDVEAARRQQLRVIDAHSAAITVAFAGEDAAMNAGRICQTAAAITRGAVPVIYPTPFPRRPSEAELRAMRTLAEGLPSLFAARVQALRRGGGLPSVTAATVSDACARSEVSFASTVDSVMGPWIQSSEFQRLRSFTGTEYVADEAYARAFAVHLHAQLATYLLDDVLVALARPERIEFLRDQARAITESPFTSPEPLVQALRQTESDICRVADLCARLGMSLSAVAWLGSEAVEAGRRRGEGALRELPRSTALALAVSAYHFRRLIHVADSALVDALLEALRAAHVGALRDLDVARAARVAEAEAQRAAAAAAPEQTPPREEIVSVMGGVQSEIAACGQGSHGVGTVAIDFAGSTGRATSVAVAGDPAGTPVGSCIARVVRGVRVRPFVRATFRVNYPVRY